MAYTEQYLANLRVRLKRLWLIYPSLTGERKEMCYKEMLKLANKTGLELGGPTLMRGPGRPKEGFSLTPEERQRAKELGMIVPPEPGHQDPKFQSEVTTLRAELSERNLTGITEEAQKARKEKIYRDAQITKKQLEMQQAINDAIERQERGFRPLTMQERALVEKEVRAEYEIKANDELAARIREEEKPDPNLSS